jgi:hypothetical protein
MAFFTIEWNCGKTNSSQKEGGGREGERGFVQPRYEQNELKFEN